MGDVVKMQGKPKKKADDDSEYVEVIVCGHCDSPGFVLAVDGRVFCGDCAYPIAASWKIDEAPPAA